VRLKLKFISHYVLDGFNGNKSGQAQLSQSAAKIDSLSASLLTSKAELEKLKVAIAQQKSLHKGVSNKQDERQCKSFRA